MNRTSTSSRNGIGASLEQDMRRGSVCSAGVIAFALGCSGGAAGPAPAGCVTDTSPGLHTFTCEGLGTTLFVPKRCGQPGCGLILELHGDTGNGPVFDANTGLMSLGDQNGYLVIAPTGPPRDDGNGSTWTLAEDDKLMAIVDTVSSVFATDAKRTHVTGFSRGGYVTWRLMCEHADRFASVAPGAGGSAPGGDCMGVSEVSCPFDATLPGGMPSRAVPVLELIGRLDAAVPLACTTRIRDQAIAAFHLGAPQALDGDADYLHTRWAGSTVLETLEHSYVTLASGPQAEFAGHCIPGSTYDPYAAVYAFPCAPPNAFRWGEEVMSFFVAHPDP
jgi:polyhydroxybutyrate depolymerase